MHGVRRSRLSWFVTCMTAAVTLPLGAGCGTTSTITLPECAARIEIVGQHQRIGDRVIELDHGLELPFTRTEIELASADGAVARTVVIENSQPEALRLLIGGGSVVASALLLGSAGYEVAVVGRDVADPQPFYSILWGSGLLVVGVVLMGTGWHPRGDTVLNDGCADAPSVR
jgi:hypothetical protein